MVRKCSECGLEHEFDICPRCYTYRKSEDHLYEVAEGTPVGSDRDKKYDAGKPMVGLMKRDFADALLLVADVSRYGVEKYKKPGSWKDVDNCRDRYEDALGRHDLQSFREIRDKESKKSHLAHRAWNALALLQLQIDSGELDEDDSV